jgi:hypothetical protein
MPIIASNHLLNESLTHCTSWNFTTSESAEFDALIFAAGKGSFYVIDDNDADGIVHEILIRRRRGTTDNQRWKQ